MNRFKRFCISISLVVVLSCLWLCANASAGDVVVSMQIDNPTMEVNGVDTEIDPGRGTSPVVINGRTLVPIRAIIEAFGGNVGWEESTSSVKLQLNDDNISLIVGSNSAYVNNKHMTLDVAPMVINDRTMLPVRFVAENFGLGVAWDSEDKIVSVISNDIDSEEYNYISSMIPEYSGNPYVRVNENVPMFKEYELVCGSFEYYSDLDNLGRCNVAMASVATDLMPNEDRESISSVTPTGWVNNYYDFVDGKYLYNRCHLIGFQLTGENANEKNLITGTRYMNVDGMLPFENMIDDYVESTGNHVLYRVSPMFENQNLVADGVLMEAYSIEDSGKGISFCVFCYNVQPGVEIDYLSGTNYAFGYPGDASKGNYADNQNYSQSNTDNYYPTDPAYTNESSKAYDSTGTSDKTESNASYGIYRTPTGKRYHFDPDCGGKNSFKTTMSEALGAGLTPCKKCAGG